MDTEKPIRLGSREQEILLDCDRRGNEMQFPGYVKVLRKLRSLGLLEPNVVWVMENYGTKTTIKGSKLAAELRTAAETKKSGK